MKTLLTAGYTLKAGIEAQQNMELLSELSEHHKNAIVDLANYVTTFKGKEVKEVLTDIRDGLWPTRRIDNDATVESEAAHLARTLADARSVADQLSFFSNEYINLLAERHQQAAFRAEQVREARAQKHREEQEEALRQQEARAEEQREQEMGPQPKIFPDGFELHVVNDEEKGLIVIDAEIVEDEPAQDSEAPQRPNIYLLEAPKAQDDADATEEGQASSDSDLGNSGKGKNRKLNHRSPRNKPAETDPAA